MWCDSLDDKTIISDDSVMAEKEAATKEASADVQPLLSRTWLDLADFVKCFKWVTQIHLYLKISVNKDK